MSQVSIIDIEGNHPQIPTKFIADVGTAIPIANTLEILGEAIPAGSVPVHTVGSGNTITTQVQISQAIAASDATKVGLAAFDSADFGVDANGFVTFTGSVGAEEFQVDAFTAPGTNPVTPNGSGVITVTGAQVAAGTTSNVIRTHSVAANAYTIEIQRSSAQASSTVGSNGVSHFNSAFFTVDSNGYVSISGTTIGQTITGQSGGALSPTAGNWNIFGASTAAGSTPVSTSGSGSTLTVNVQKSQAIAGTDATKVGLAAFDNTKFTVDANGFVSISGSTIGQTITGNSGGALSPSSGNWNILATSVAAGTTPAATSGSGSTLTVNIQRSQAIATTNATNVGLAAFYNGDFNVDSNGFVSLTHPGCICTQITGDTTLAVNTCNYTNFAEGANLTLPATATVCDTIEVNFGTQGQPTIVQNAGQQIRFGNTTTTAGVLGGMTSTSSGDCIKLKCITGGASTLWEVISSVGTWNVF